MLLGLLFFFDFQWYLFSFLWLVFLWILVLKMILEFRKINPLAALAGSTEQITASISGSTMRNRGIFCQISIFNLFPLFSYKFSNFINIQGMVSSVQTDGKRKHYRRNTDGHYDTGKNKTGRNRINILFRFRYGSRNNRHLSAEYVTLCRQKQVNCRQHRRNQ